MLDNASIASSVPPSQKHHGSVAKNNTFLKLPSSLLHKLPKTRLSNAFLGERHMKCICSHVYSTTVNFRPPEHKGVSRTAALKCCEQHSLHTQNRGIEVTCSVTAPNRQTFGMRYKTKTNGH